MILKLCAPVIFGALLLCAIVSYGGEQVMKGPLVTREEFFAGLDYSIPGLAEVKKAVDSKDYDSAAKSLLDYMRSRRNVKYTVNSWEMPASTQAGYDTSQADDICNHIFQGGLADWYPPYHLDKKIDWAASPYNDREWYWGINRHSHWSILADTYWATRDEKYAREFVEELEDWVVNRPVVTDGTHNSSPSWRTIEAGIRMQMTWPGVYQHFLNSPSFTPQANLLFMMSLVDHARHLEKNPTGGNWLLMERNGLLHIGVLYPEIKESAHWRRLAIETLDSELARQVYADGFQFELTTTYHRVCIQNFREPLDICRLNSVELPAEYQTNLLRMYDAVMYLVKPNGYVPATNDADARIDTVSESGKWADAHSDMSDGAKRFSRQDMLYVATDGKEGVPPAQVSHEFAYAGFYVMRGAWSKDSLYLIFDAGPFGAGHQHEDKLSFEAYAYGQTLLFDPGRYSYADPVYGPWIRSTAAHNTCLIDGKGQGRASQPESDRKWITSSPAGNVWLNEKGFDYAEGSYDEGYGPNLDKSVTHHRSVMFIKDGYWLIEDRFQGIGKHTVNTLFHFAQGKVEPDEKTLACVTRNDGRPNLLVYPADSQNVKVSIREGSESPCQGWLSGEYNHKVPAPVADYEWAGELPSHAAYLLVPSKPGQSPSGKLERLEMTIDGVPADAHASAYLVRHGDGTADYILLAHGISGTKAFGGITTDAQLAVIRTDAHGAVIRSSIYAGTFARRGSQETY